MIDFERVTFPGDVGLEVDADANVKLYLPEGEEDQPIASLLAAMVAACMLCVEDEVFRNQCLDYWAENGRTLN